METLVDMDIEALKAVWAARQAAAAAEAAAAAAVQGAGQAAAQGAAGAQVRPCSSLYGICSGQTSDLLSTATPYAQRQKSSLPARPYVCPEQTSHWLSIAIPFAERQINSCLLVPVWRLLRANPSNGVISQSPMCSAELTALSASHAC